MDESSSDGDRARRGGRGRGRGYGRGRSAPRDGAIPQDGDGAAAKPEREVDPVSRAKEICLNLLAMQPRTKAELRTKLLGKGIEADVADGVLGRLHEVGLVDDAAFAEMYVRSRHTYQGMARRALSMELRRKGVDDQLAAEAVSAVDSESEEARARELVRKRLRSVNVGTTPELTVLRRLVGMLARKGYSEGMAYRVVRDELQQAGADTEVMDDALPD